MGNVVMEATQINYRRDDTMKTVDQKLQELSQESAIDTDIAPVFKSTSTYNPGNLVYYRNKLYKCITQHTGAWAAVDFAATDVSTALNAAVGALDDTKADLTDLATPFNSETSYTAGDLVIYNGIIYRCTNDHTGDWDADDFSATTIGAELNAINSNLTSSETILTIENANITAERKSVKRFGKVCVIDLIFTVSAAITGNTALLFSGAPKAKDFAENNFRFTAVEVTNANIVPAVMNIDNNGKMYNQWTTGGIQPGVYTANATYICQ